MDDDEVDETLQSAQSSQSVGSEHHGKREVYAQVNACLVGCGRGSPSSLIFRSIDTRATPGVQDKVDFKNRHFEVDAFVKV